MNSDSKRTDFSPLSEHDGLVERYKGKNLDGILELHNRTPVWNDDTQSYVLNFHGRVTQVTESYSLNDPSTFLNFKSNCLIISFLGLSEEFSNSS